jgi:hypothetical protein
VIINQTNELETLDLSGLPLVGFNIDAQYGDYAIDFPIPNPHGNGSCNVKLGSGGFIGSSLLNSRFDRLTVKTISGQIRMAFDGLSLEQDMHVRIETECGGIWLEVPDWIPARISYHSCCGDLVRTDAAFARVDSTTYQTSGYDCGESPRLEIEIDSVMGDLRLIRI